MEITLEKNWIIVVTRWEQNSITWTDMQLNKNQGPKVDLLDAVNEYEGIAFFQ